MKKREPTEGRRPTSGKGKKAVILNVAILVASLALITIGGTLVYADHLLGRVQFEPDPVQSLAPDNLGVISFGDIGNSKYVVNGLYHDDKILNVLLMGIDGYRENDEGRNDSMLMASLDRRHEKLKMTFLMRDTYVSILGHQANKPTVAYSIGGSTLTVQTIENEFDMDIDRYVLISNDFSNRITDRLSGAAVEVNGTEAELVNTYSGKSYSKRLTSGIQHMTGKQARYYSRIRGAGNDYEHTLRQRKVLQTIIDEFKTSDLGTINGILYDMLPLMTANMTKNEILPLAANSLTYLNYPTSQNRIPVDGIFDDWNVPGVGSSLVVNFKKNHEDLVEFIYEENLGSSDSSQESSFESR